MPAVKSVFTLPLYPLQGAVLLPGERVSVPWGREAIRAILERARGFGGAVVASLADGESVHEVGVTAVLSDEGEKDATLHGISRCRLLSLVSEDVTLVRAESYPEGSPAGRRGGPVARLLLARYERLCQRIGKSLLTPAREQDLSTVTWRVTADLGFSAEEQQGFLNVPDPLTRGKLLLLALRELERRERFLRRWSHLRTTTSWN
jgi:Lon protease-like protein